MDNRYQTYRQVEINTTNRGKIVVMLYSGAITFLNKAKIYMEKKDYSNKGKFLIKALNIIEELNIALDMAKGQEISKNLRSIYLFLERYLSKANLENDPVKIEKSIDILEKLKSAFEEILTNPDLQEAHQINKREQIQNSIRKII
ncbi:MAG: flagellar export chaperone FliS [Sphaerochaetaceae bacterium]|jgi:flagellar protein FliS|nr:flagellar export chaperone FliS [Candidatus Cloacimonadota bacterium]MDD3367241.1 flagellar export chaperone FliS [Sphaerochaetaceae bacterium]MDD4156613.1 flagellar export chaperone FliS [Candidatus Cloacimonadota bacterium]